jgi:hypothetical protein
MHIRAGATTAVEAGALGVEEEVVVVAVGRRTTLNTMAAGTSSTLDVLRIPMHKVRMVANGGIDLEPPR